MNTLIRYCTDIQIIDLPTETCVPFETPYSLCETFRGREDVLDHMVDHFFPSDDTEPRQISFAICGLGTN